MSLLTTAPSGTGARTGTSSRVPIWVHYRRSVLQERCEHGNARRESLEQRGNAAGLRDLHQRNRFGLAAGEFRESRRGYCQYGVCRFLPQYDRALERELEFLREF